MPEKSSGKPRFVLTTRRIEALADGIFAFAMTLLVLSLTLPDATQTKLSLSQLLAGQWPKFFNYALSFLLLAIFWIVHHQQFHVIRRTDRLHVWINVGILMFVALMPFSASILANYLTVTSEVFFAGNLMALGLLLMANWIYATKGCRLIAPELDEETIKRNLRRAMVTPIVAAAVMGLSIPYPERSFYAYILILVVLLTPRFRNR